MQDDKPKTDFRWDDYEHLSELFRFYLDLVLKAFTFALGVSGAVVAFILGKDVQNLEIASFGLLLPSVLCIGMGVAFIRAIPSSRELTEALSSLKVSLGLQLAPHGKNLSVMLNWFGWILLSSGVFLFILFINLYCCDS